MHITLIAVGTRGDVQPLLALAVGLRQAGYEIRVATTLEFEALVRAYDLDFFLLNGSPSQLMQGTNLSAAMGGTRNPMSLIRGILDVFNTQFEQGLAEVWTACQGSDAIIVSMLGFYVGCHVVEKLSIPLFEGYVLPGRPTRAFPSPLLPFNLRLGGTASWFSHILLLNLAWQLLQPVVNRARRRVLNLPPLVFRRLFRQLEQQHQPVLNGYSPLLLPKPADWSAWHHVTGYWFLDRPNDWQPPNALEDFLGSGSPPVYVGFGSMSSPDPNWLSKTVLEALRASGQRGLLLTGWGGLRPSTLPENVFQIETIPHDWLFPRIAAAVHHGGSGTTAAALCAGIPSIVVPFHADQYLWGRCVHQRGVGPAPIPLRQLTAARLTQAIRTVLEDRGIRQNAATLGQQIRGEDGVGRAVAVIKQSLSR